MTDLPVGYLEFLWLTANFMIGLALVHLPYEIRCWFRDIPNGTGFRPLAQIFQALLLTGAVHHFALLSAITMRPLSGYLVVADCLLAFVSMTASIALYRARVVIHAAFASMMAHRLEWSGVDTSPPQE